MNRSTLSGDLFFSFFSRILWSGVTLLLLWPAQALSESNPPEVILQQAVNKTIAVLKTDVADSKANDRLQRAYEVVDQNASPYFDFEKMASLVLGGVWKTITDEQKMLFLQNFKRLLVGSYASAIFEYVTKEQQEIKYLPVKYSDNPNVVVVPTQVVRQGASPIAIDYRMYRSDGQWRIFDVVIDQVSLVINYRASFASQIRTGGFEQLLVTLGKHNQRF